MFMFPCMDIELKFISFNEYEKLNFKYESYKFTFSATNNYKNQKNLYQTRDKK